MIWCEQNYKSTVRRRTIIDVYRNLFNEHSLPTISTYWTLCGDNCTQDGRASNKSELGQLTSSKLITPFQFHGIDNDATIITRNKMVYPKANWYHGDFVSITRNTPLFLETARVINLDTMAEPKNACRWLSDTMLSLSHRNRSNILIIVNMITKNPRRSSKVFCSDYILDIVSSDYNIQLSVECGWKMLDNTATYNSGNTTMQTIWWYLR